ncbi:hypothetical protein UlMin_033539 [Ulmus minor]
MALRGVWQLEKLIVNYCDWGGSKNNPQLEVVTEVIRGQNMDPEEVLDYPTKLRNSLGRKVVKMKKELLKM